jgi:hypothetical protein
MAEYGSSGIWAAEPVGPFRHGMVPYAKLHLDADLILDFEAWILRYWQRRESGFNTPAFNAEGLRLAKELKRHMGPETEVLFAPESESGGLEAELVIDA